MKKYFIIINTLLLSIFGLFMVYSSSGIWSEYKFNDSLYYFKHQLIFFIIGFIIMLILSKVNYKIYYKYSNLFLFITLLLLVLVLIPGIGQVRNGSRSWFGVGGLGIQPSELCKISLVIFVAKYLSNNKDNVKNIIKGVIPIIIVIGLFFGLIMLEPDFGSGMVITSALVCMLFVSDISYSFFAGIGIFGIIGIVILIIIAPYRLQRITSFINPWLDPLGSGFQIIQSLYSIGPGGLFGMGIGNSIQKYFYLPEPQTDFIFSVISEEFGFLGVLIVSILFFNLFRMVINVSLKCDDLFGKYLSFGLIVSIIIQTVLNICVVIGLVPVTGVTLPFISYGGSSLLISLCSIGIILNICSY